MQILISASVCRYYKFKTYFRSWKNIFKKLSLKKQGFFFKKYAYCPNIDKKHLYNNK